MKSVPGGTVTFLFTDIEGSTRLLQKLGDRYGELAVLDAKTLVENRHFPAAWCAEKADDVAPPSATDE